MARAGTYYQAAVLVMVLVCVLMVLCMAQGDPGAGAAATVDKLSCSTALNMMTPCLPFLSSQLLAQPGNACCASSKRLDAIMLGGGYKLDLCLCLRNAAHAAKGLVLAHATSLPGLCGLKVVRFDPAAACP